MALKENVQELSSSKFLDAIKKEKVIVKFYAEWCMPCVILEPIFEGVASNHKEIVFAKMNVDEAQEIASNYKISSIPCIIFFKDGKEIDRIVGSISEEELEGKVEKILK